MLHLEAPHTLLQITDNDDTSAKVMKIANLADRMWAIVNHQHQKEQHLRQLMDVYGDTVDRMDCHIRAIEGAYHKLWQETQYVYE